MNRLVTFTLLAGTMIAGNAGAQSTARHGQSDKYTRIETTLPTAQADLDMKAVLSSFSGLKPKPIEGLTPEEARAQPTVADAVKALKAEKGMSTEPDASVVTRDISVAGGEGMIPARVYTPAGASGMLPVVVYFHGGGFVIATNDVYDASPRAIAKMANAVVVSVEYRKAPEHKFPAAHDDAFAAYRWVLANAGSIGGDSRRVAVMGESAGGNLAINVSLAARTANIPLPVYQVLVYPVAGVDMMTPSYIENEHAKPLNKAMMKWFFKHTIRSDKDKKDPRLDLVGLADVRGLPATTVITAQIDPLRSEGEALAAKLQAGGVPVDLKNYAGVTHEFFGMGDVIAKAKDAETLAAKDLDGAFAEAARQSN